MKGVKLIFLLSPLSWSSPFVVFASNADQPKTTSVVVDTSTATTTATTGTSTNGNVTVLGLGGMGVAVVKCLSSMISQQQQNKDGTNKTNNILRQHIHAWNRGEKKRQHVIDMNLTNVYVHESIHDAVQASDIVLTMIDDWDGTIQLLKELVFDPKTKVTLSDDNKPTTMIQKKRIILFSTYTPHDIQNLYKSINTSSHIHLIGGAIVGVPQTICTPNAYIISSSNGENSDRTNEQSVGVLKNDDEADVKLVLDFLGTNVRFLKQDVGLAALANLALIQSITFGIVGHELSQLLFQLYPGITNKFLQTYDEYVVKIVPTYISMLLPFVSKHVTYVPAKTFLNVMKLHMTFCTQLGISNDIYLASYIKYLEPLKNISNVGPASWIEHAKLKSKLTNSDDGLQYHRDEL